MLHGSEMWPVKKANELTLSWLKWMCDVKITGRFSSSELRERLGLDDIITVLPSCFKRDRSYPIYVCVILHLAVSVEYRVVTDRRTTIVLT